MRPRCRACWAGNYYGGFYTESDSTGDIHKFTHGLAAAAARLGAVFRCQQNVMGLQTDGHGAHVSVDNGRGVETESFDTVVICAGTASRRFAAMLGDRVNIYPVKGYSITVNLLDEASQRSAPTVSLLDDETKLVTSRLGVDRFRVAGTAEFNGFNKDIRADRLSSSANAEAPVSSRHWTGTGIGRDQLAPARCSLELDGHPTRAR